MKLSKLLFLSLLTSYFQSSLAQSSQHNYESCCGTQAVEFAYDKKKVFIPNVFTPNKDGLNDTFFPHTNGEVHDVWWFSVYSAKGDTLIYQTMHLDLTVEPKNDRAVSPGWNGLRQDGTPYQGLFRYRMRIDDKDANKHIVEGFACAVLCGPEAKAIQTKEGCFYGSQSAGGGAVDKAKLSQEKDCH